MGDREGGERVISVPERPSLDGIEARWEQCWDDEGTYRFDRTQPRERVFSIDTPPPTVSGSLHIGHVFSYTQTDAIARYQRMRGHEVFYPMGWDDNGLATERRVERHFGVRCDPSVVYDAGLVAPGEGTKSPVPISRRNFIDLCAQLTARDEQVFKETWRRLGLSVDWSYEYATISEVARRASQRGFLRMLGRSEVYSTVAPTLWDVDFKTAVSQAELVDRDHPGAYHRVSFRLADGPGTVEIETTRPELLPSCVALVANPDDPRYQPLFGHDVITPLFGVRVPVVAHALAEPDKGTGIAMVCTFGDTTDVVWWRELALATRPLIGRDGRFAPATFGEAPFDSEDPTAANAAYATLAGRTAKQAQAAIVELLTEACALIGDPRPITHPVKFYEKGDRPLEIVSSRQWFVRTMSMRDEVLARGHELAWYPAHMAHRFTAWVEGLNSDWCISRQRYFGVPFPVWYRVREDGTVDHDEPLLADESRLPVDPSTDVPAGFDEAARGQPGGFVGDPDVMDTWATSSLTPHIAGHWVDDDDLFTRVFPMDMRAQAHDIIRTWLFSSVVRSELEHHVLPWRAATISGWVVDPDRKKMGKSSGNAVTPMALLEEFGSDALRYWAASGRLGTDTVEDPAQMRVGRRLAIKVLNASRFALSRLDGEVPGPEALSDVTEDLDRDLLAQLASLVRECTTAFDEMDYARTLERTEAFFWRYCDDYLELVKTRAYGEAGEAATNSARAALGISLSVLLRLLAPFLCFTTEEVWRWWHEGSIHRAAWPDPAELAAAAPSVPGVLSAASEALTEVRKAKTTAKRSMRAEVTAVTVRGPAGTLAALDAARQDLLDAGTIARLELIEADDVAVVVELAEDAPAPAG